MNNIPWYLDALKQGVEAAENMNIHPDLKQAAIDQGIRPAGYDSSIEEIDFVAEHPKKDMSKVSRIVVNGKVYLAADKIMEIMTEAERHDQYFRYAYGEIEKLKGGEQG